MGDGLFGLQQSDGHIVQPSARKRNLACCVAVVVALIVASPYALGSGIDSEDSTSETRIITLQPGNNFIGWVSDPISVDDVFDAIPEAALIYTWDADRRSWRSAIRDVGGSLTVLEPGMAAMIRIDGARPVQWERPLTPAKGMVTLYRGVNWVTWVGRDEWPLDQVARGIGKSLVSIRVGDVTWPAPLDSSIDDLPTLRRGDALQVTVSRDLRWLQPTGIIPDIEWVGPVPQSLRDTMTEEISELLDYFAETHGVETDFSDTGIVIWHTAADAVKYQSSDPKYPFHLSGEALRVYLEHDAEGGGTAWGMHLKSSWWRPNPRVSIFKTHLTHEWFHYLQIQYTDFFRASGVPLEWILEGTAVWSGDFGIRLAEGHQTFEQSRQEYTDNAARTSVTLRSAERRNTPWQYELGVLAIDLLVERSGQDSFVEYFRLQHPQAVGTNRQWQSTTSLDDAFRMAFGIELDAFYKQFAEWRSGLPHTGARYDYYHGDRTMAGNLHHSNGDPAMGFWVTTAPYIGVNKSGRIRRTHVRDDGSFTIDLVPNTTQRLWITHDDCTLWLTDDGLATTRPEASEYRLLDTRNLRRLNLMIPADVCSEAQSINVEVLRLRGDDRSLAIVMNSEDGELWLPVSRAPSGGYLAFAPEPGRYRIKLIVGGCELWYRNSGPVAQRGKGDSLVLSRQSMSIKFRVPDDMCIRTIRGRAVTADGRPADARLLYAYKHDVYGHATWGEDGQFAITVPEAGEYRVYVWDGCPVYLGNSSFTTEWHQATPISVEDEDVTGIEFIVPADPSSLCK